MVTALAYDYDRQRLAATLHVGRVVLKDEGERWTLSGSYAEMQPIIPALKKQRKWFWDPRDRLWWAQKNALGPRQLAAIKKLVEPGEADDVVSDTYQALTAKALSLKLTGARFGKTPQGVITLDVPSTALAEPIRRAGGEWAARLWLFPQDRINVKGFEALLKKAEDYSADLRAKTEVIARLIDNAKFPLLRVSVSLEGATLRLEGKTYDFKEDIKPVGLRWNDTRWRASVDDIDTRRLEKLLDRLRQAEADRAREEQERRDRPRDDRDEAQAELPKKRTNYRAQACSVCGEMVPSGQGWLVSYFDDDEDEVAYRVSHKDTKICEEVRRETAKRHEKAVSIATAKRKLEQLCVRAENYVQGEGHRPPGESHYIDDRGVLYGGGIWVVIEPDERHIWYVRNNGADGDDWAHNNVATGGAGAIGYRAPLTPEIRGLVEAIIGKPV